MEPPWEKHPEIPVGSIGWRMGSGEDYYNEFYRWFSGLSAEEQIAYSSANPAPLGWGKLYDAIIDHPWH